MTKITENLLNCRGCGGSGLDTQDGQLCQWCKGVGSNKAVAEALQPPAHTPGATRVAASVLNNHTKLWTKCGVKTQLGLAELIDSKTGLLDLLEAAQAAGDCILAACRVRFPDANSGTGSATPEEQVALEMLRAAIAKATA